MIRIKISILLAIISSLIININIMTSIVSANPCTSPNCVDVSPLPTTSAGSSTVGVVLNLTFVVLGAVAVLIMVLAGFRYITSSGKPEELAKAKDTIIYAAVGIIVCLSAVTIVSFVAGFIK